MARQDRGNRRRPRPGRLAPVAPEVMRNNCPESDTCDGLDMRSGIPALMVLLCGGLKTRWPIGFWHQKPNYEFSGAGSHPYEWT